MSLFKPWTWFKKRTEADIQKAKLLDEAKEKLDATKDSKYIASIDGIIAKWSSLKARAKSLKLAQILSETEIIERDLGILRGTIVKEISDL